MKNLILMIILLPSCVLGQYNEKVVDELKTINYSTYVGGTFESLLNDLNKVTSDNTEKCFLLKKKGFEFKGVIYIYSDSTMIEVFSQKTKIMTLDYNKNQSLDCVFFESEIIKSIQVIIDNQVYY